MEPHRNRKIFLFDNDQYLYVLMIAITSGRPGPRDIAAGGEAGVLCSHAIRNTHVFAIRGSVTPIGRLAQLIIAHPVDQALRAFWVYIVTNCETTCPTTP